MHTGLTRKIIDTFELRIIQLILRTSTHCSVFSCLLCPGGRVTFNVGNDSPTLTGAKVTFTIDLEFPHNQKVQPNGDVVWAEDCVVDGNTLYTSSLVKCFRYMLHK